MERKPFKWKKKKIWTTPDFLNVLIEIEKEEDAESFVQAYSEVCDQAEEMIGYYARLIGAKKPPENDPDYWKYIKEDILDLFMVDEVDTLIRHNFGHPANGVPGSSLGLKVKTKTDNHRLVPIET